MTKREAGVSLLAGGAFMLMVTGLGLLIRYYFRLPFSFAGRMEILGPLGVFLVIIGLVYLVWAEREERRKKEDDKTPEPND